MKLLSDGIYAIQILTVDSHIKKGKFVSDHLHLDCCFLFEADEEELLQIKEDENSAVGWIEIERVTEVTNEEKMQMGIMGRKKVEREFNRQIVINAYLDAIKNIRR